ncbi:hypothetical protein GGI15_004555 [Coemansia interrupta]|uniref:MFS transporter n=1 Tax=Coemansia interrupta TaxID=1126814 RepID=A0A9W8H3U6_9FUNG|nr:hypothetical protein GGI15_004555 [Coemansia interrupta]
MSSKVEYIEVDSLGDSPVSPDGLELRQSADSLQELGSEKTRRMLDKYCAKIDRRILIYAIVLCVLNQSDRGSIGVAKVVGLEEDLGMANNDFNIAATLFTVGYLSLEVFSNFILKFVGASRLLPTLGVLWGLVCALQGVIRTKTQLYVMRLLLGMAECGFTAGILLILSFFYPKQRLTTRDTKRALFDWQLWCMTLATFATCASSGSVSIFAPEVINELGFSPAQSQAMSALPSACGAITILLSGQIVRVCRGHWLAGSLSLAVALTGSVIMVSTLSIPLRILGLCLLGAGGFAGLGILPGWNITANSQTVANSTVASALTVFMGASSGFVASNVFLNWDAPRFVIGHTVNIAILALGICACIVTRINMGRRNRRYKQEGLAGFGNEATSFRYVY